MIMNQHFKTKGRRKRPKDVYQNSEWFDCDYFSHTFLDFSMSLTTFKYNYFLSNLPLQKKSCKGARENQKTINVSNYV